MPTFTKGDQVIETSSAVEGARLRAAGFTEKEAPAGDDYESLKVADLKAEIERRNEGRDEEDQIPATGNKADLVEALAADDE